VLENYKNIHQNLK